MKQSEPPPAAVDWFINEFDVARFTGMSVASVRRWRLLDKGPKFVKVGASVRYRLSDVTSWMESL